MLDSMLCESVPDALNNSRSSYNEPVGTVDILLQTPAVCAGVV
jgi:hypothetical protein